MMTLLSWLIRRIGVPTLFTFTLVLIAVGTVALGVRGVVRALDIELVSFVTIVALLTGWVLSKLPFPGWLASIVAVVLGIETIAFRVGQLGGKVDALLRTLSRFLWQLFELIWGVLYWQPRGAPDTTPFFRALADLLNALNALLIRFRDWLSAVASGIPAYDPVAVAIAWCVVFWLIAIWAAWGVRRREQPFVAMVPGMALLAAILAYTRADSLALIPPLGATLLLMALVGHTARERHWQSVGISAAQDLESDLLVVAIPLSFLLIAAAWATPSVSIRQIVRTAQQVMREQIGEAGRLPDSLGLEIQPTQPTLFDELYAPGLPRHHLLGSGVELSHRLAMIVKTDDVRASPVGSVAPPHYYWRSATYDRYSGYGWSSDRDEVIDYEAGVPVITEPMPAHRTVRQNVQVIGNLGGLLYATGTLVTADHDFRVAWRAPGDVFGADISATLYRAESRVPAVGEEQLRSAGADYPDWVAARYLSLPDNLPARVLGLGRDLTATQLAPYDRVRAIEDYLRTFPYTLDLSAPPPNRDVVDYFLFDLKKGYCDYFATAMVVLSRAAGVPARLVVGYASGGFDEEDSQYVVTEADAHAWVEVYFPDYGWVEFEPTGNRPLIDRSAQATTEEMWEEEAKREVNPLERVTLERNWWLVVPAALAVFTSAIIGAFAIDDWRLQRLAPSVAVAEIYRRLNRHAKRLGVPVRVSDTPNEFAAMSVEWLAPLRMTSEGIRALTALYVQTCYSPRSPDSAARTQAIHVWRQLRRALWWTWVRKKTRRA